MKLALRALLLGGLLAWHGPLLAWGEDGHRIIGELAERRLPDAVLGEVRLLLDHGGHGGHDGLAAVSTWADEVRRQPEWRWSAALHFVNFPRGDCRYLPDRDCPDGACIVAAIPRFAAELADRELPTQQRLEALKWLVHLVGDLHQPLHAGYGDDRGGNDFQINYLGRGSNLHAAWDSLLIQSKGIAWQDYVDRLQPRLTAEAAPQAATASVAWAEESCRVIEDADIYPDRPGRILREYLDRQRPVAEQRLVLAAERLAGLLIEVLDRQATP